MCCGVQVDMQCTVDHQKLHINIKSRTHKTSWSLSQHNLSVAKIKGYENGNTTS